MHFKQMKKAPSRTSLSKVHSETKSYGDKTQMFPRSRSVRWLLSYVIIDAIADSIPRILLVPNVVLLSAKFRYIRDIILLFMA